jgi:hypothetical protein
MKRLFTERLGVCVTLALIGCDDGSPPLAEPPSAAEANLKTSIPGMSKFSYVAADGGPHLFLPAEAAGAWSGAPSMFSVMTSTSDYGRACAATSNAQMALISVGSSSALVFANPPMTASGKSADGLVEIYYLKSWSNTDLDSLISKATAALPTAALTDSTKVVRLENPDAFLLYAGDTPSSVAYSIHRVAISAGTYKILHGTYSAPGESVTIYRLSPVKAPADRQLP